MITINGKEYTREQLFELRELIEKVINNLEDEDAVIGTTLFPVWNDLLAERHEFTQDDVSAGFRCRYESVLYKVLQPHTVQETWNPKDAPSLFAKVLIPDENVIPEWEQPDSTNAYKTGDKVMYNGEVYESLIDNNVWEPSAYQQEWKKVV